MKRCGKRTLGIGVGLLAAFVLWTVMIIFIDVQAVGAEGSSVGFATFNSWFHSLTGVHLTVYVITDWAGLVPVAVCFAFGIVGFCQLVARRSLRRVDCDILCLGIYYIIVISGYLLFEMIPVNCRPILIGGFLEVSYPSSTTLLVLSVMPTLSFQVERRIKNICIKRIINGLSVAFSAGVVIGRLVSGVHWFTDIVGGVLLSAGLFCLYKGTVVLMCEDYQGDDNMEFCEKLQSLRKSRGITQEELAQALCVSRTAVSKWESGRGLPSIDSLKDIAEYFSVTIDELLSGEKLLSIAENENKTNIRNLCGLLFGIVDLLSVLLIILPLYPQVTGGGIFSVNLFDYVGGTGVERLVSLVLFSVMIVLGIVRVVMAKRKKDGRMVMDISMVLGILTVLFLAVTRKVYVVTVAFLLLVVKAVLLFRSAEKSHK